MLIQYCRTEFSVGSGFLSPKEAVTCAADQGYNSILLADDMSISALIPATVAAKKLDSDFRVLCGVKLNIVDHPTYEHEKRTAKEKKEAPPADVKRGRSYSIVAIAKNDQGFTDLCQLLSLANERDHFYQVPRLDLNQVLHTFSLGNIVLITSDVNSVIYRPDCDNIIDQLLSAGNRDDLLAAIYPVNTPLYDQLNAKTLALAERTHLQSVCFNPAYYATDANADDKDLMYLIANNIKPDQHYRIRSPYQRNSSIKDRSLPIAELSDFMQRMDVTVNKREVMKDAQQMLLDKCQYQWTHQPPCLPKMADDEPLKLRELAKAGLKWRLTSSCFGYVPPEDQHQEYVERLKYELSILDSMGFSGYFLLVQEVMQFARNRHIPVGCGRGSVGGSLVAFCMGITEIDPMRFGLLFERFINPERDGLPDADLDLSQARRHEVMDYLTAKYGQDYVAGIVTHRQLKTASSFRDTVRVLGYPDKIINISKEITALNKVIDGITLGEAVEHIPRLREFARTDPDVFAAMERLHGRMNGYGRHPSGFIVSDVPINTRAVMERRSDELVINWDMSCCEDNGLIKLDLLGLANLDLMALACQYIKERHDVDINMYDIPLDDEKTLANFAKAETTGVFQLESSGMKKILSDLGNGIEPMIFETIVHTTALFRPGPMESGALDQFVAIAKGFAPIEPVHPLLNDLLAETNGVMVYQEQVMSALRILAGFSLGEADLCRRAMGKKRIDKMLELKDDFVKRCETLNAIPESVATDVWNKIESFAGYGFNKSHAAAYSTLSFQVMYVKTHYPAEFFAAALSILPSDKHAGLVLNARDYGIELYPPCINHSSSRLEIAQKDGLTILFAPFNVVKGCSDNSANAIVQARNDAGGEFKSVDHMMEFVQPRQCNKTLRANFEKIGAFHCFDPDSPKPLDPVRRQDQSLYMPDMTIDPVRSVRAFLFDAKKKAQINLLHKRIEDELDLGCTIVRPSMPNKPKLAIVLDYANKNDAGCGFFAERNYEDYLHNLMEEVGFGRDDYYITGIKKTEKSGGYSNELERAYKTYFQTEMELLSAPVILAMGREATDFFSGGKKKASELQGRTTFDAKRDATIVYGINPMILYPRPELRDDVLAILKVAYIACYGEDCK